MDGQGEVIPEDLSVAYVDEAKEDDDYGIEYAEVDTDMEESIAWQSGDESDRPEALTSDGDGAKQVRTYSGREICEIQLELERGIGEEFSIEPRKIRVVYDKCGNDIKALRRTLTDRLERTFADVGLTPFEEFGHSTSDEDDGDADTANVSTVLDDTKDRTMSVAATASAIATTTAAATATATARATGTGAATAPTSTTAASTTTISTVSAMFECPVCYDEVPMSSTYAISCCPTHRQCNTCWRKYLSTMVLSKFDSVFARCPGRKCNQPLSFKTVCRFLTPTNVARYQRWIADFVVSSKPEMQWCPNNSASCTYAILCSVKGSAQHEVSCACSYKFCWKCRSEAHSPTTCELVEAWRIKGGEGEAAKRLKVMCKQCPRCGSWCYIKDKVACNHMTCTCKHEWCWMCGGPWSLHGEKTGGYYKCNKFDSAKAEGGLETSSLKKMRDRKSVAYYEFCAGRFAEHLRAQQSASRHLLRTVDQNMINLQGGGKKGRCSLMDLQFALDAVSAVQECRRVLKWTYVARYFLKEGNAKKIFEDQQGRLEHFTDILHEQLADNEASKMDELTNPYVDNSELFVEWKRKIVDYTRTSLQFMRQFCDAAKDGRTLLGLEEPAIRRYALQRGGSVEAFEEEEEEANDIPVGWACIACTFWNAGRGGRACTVCGTARHAE